MFENFLFNEVLMAIVYLIAIFVVLEFARTKDGVLRKIMIAYFSVEAFMYMASAVYFAGIRYHFLYISPDLFRATVLIPKVVVKLWLLWYLVKGRKRS